MKIAKAFAKFVAATEFQDMDLSVIEYVKKMTLKQVMGILVGSTAPTSKKVIRYAQENPGRSEAGVYGCGFKADAPMAALVNGFLGHASEMEDDQFPGGGISDVTTVPALLPAAEKYHLSGKEYIVALYVGQEMQNRIAYYASVGTDGIGICNLPFLGIYGATASVAKAYELTEEQILSSFGFAMVQGLGYMHTWGTDSHFWESATVCRNALMNVYMAQSGATSNPVIAKCLDMLTGGDKNIEFDKMIEGLGKPPYYTNQTWLKKWGFCFFTHNFVDVMADLMKEHSVKYEDVDEAVLHFDPLRYIVDRPEPHDAEDSRFSTQHVLAYQLVHGECGLDTCTEEAVHDPVLAEARQKFKVEYHDEYPKRYFSGEGRIDLKLKNGQTLTGGMAQPYGGPDNPLMLGQVVDIYRRYLKGIMPAAHIERSANIILELENQPDLQELFDICTFRHMVAL